MRSTRSGKPLVPAALVLAVLATVAASPAGAVTKLHDPVFNHATIVYGATNGSGAYRGHRYRRAGADRGLMTPRCQIIRFGALQGRTPICVLC